MNVGEIVRLVAEIGVLIGAVVAGGIAWRKNSRELTKEETEETTQGYRDLISGLRKAFNESERRRHESEVNCDARLAFLQGEIDTQQKHIVDLHKVCGEQQVEIDLLTKTQKRLLKKLQDSSVIKASDLKSDPDIEKQK